MTIIFREFPNTWQIWLRQIISPDSDCCSSTCGLSSAYALYFFKIFAQSESYSSPIIEEDNIFLGLFCMCISSGVSAYGCLALIFEHVLYLPLGSPVTTTCEGSIPLVFSSSSVSQIIPLAVRSSMNIVSLATIEPLCIFWILVVEPKLLLASLSLLLSCAHVLQTHFEFHCYSLDSHHLFLNN